MFERIRKGCVWEGVVTEQRQQHIDPHSYGHNSVSFPFSWAAQPGALGPASLGYVPHSSIFSATAQSGGPEGPSARCWFSLPHLQLTWTSCHWGYIIIWRQLFFLRASQFRTQFNPLMVKVISWYSSTGCTCYLHRCISYFDTLAGSGVNIQQKKS